MDAADFKTVKDCLGQIRDIQIQYAKKIIDELDKKYKVGRSWESGDPSFKNAVWIDIPAKDNRELKYDYRITMFLNERDTDSGNFHTQLGRIQFWAFEKGTTEGGAWPYVDCSWNQDGFYPTSSLEDTFSSDPGLLIGIPEFSAKSCISSFEIFLNEETGDAKEMETKKFTRPQSGNYPFAKALLNMRNLQKDARGWSIKEIDSMGCKSWLKDHDLQVSSTCGLGYSYFTENHGIREKGYNDRGNFNWIYLSPLTEDGSTKDSEKNVYMISMQHHSIDDKGLLFVEFGKIQFWKYNASQKDKKGKPQPFILDGKLAPLDLKRCTLLSTEKEPTNLTVDDLIKDENRAKLIEDFKEFVEDDQNNFHTIR